MTTDQLRNVHQSQPFRPFSLHLADSRVLGVPHRDFLSQSPSGRTLIVYGEDDSFSIVDLLLVTRIEVHSSQPSEKNGESE